MCLIKIHVLVKKVFRDSQSEKSQKSLLKEITCDVLRDLASFKHIQKREKLPRRSLLLVKLQAFSLQLY